MGWEEIPDGIDKSVGEPRTLSLGLVHFNQVRGRGERIAQVLL